MLKKTKLNLQQLIGAIGAVAWIALFAYRPSFPTPDKLIIFLVFVFMVFRQATAMLKRLAPFVVLILVYESFRSIVPRLNNRVNYTLAPHFDRWLFGQLPTKTLQNWLWHGRIEWYDVALYIPYLLFFVVPLGFAILVWKTREKNYWQVITTYMVCFFSAFLTFLAFPAAPPWLASQNHYIEPIVRISSGVWAKLGLGNTPSFYNHLSANPVAAVPSLHSAIATLTSLLIFKLYGRKWGLASLIYPLLIYFGVVYEGEHYVFDVLGGILYAAASYWLTLYLFTKKARLARRFKLVLTSSTKSA